MWRLLRADGKRGAFQARVSELQWDLCMCCSRPSVTCAALFPSDCFPEASLKPVACWCVSSLFLGRTASYSSTVTLVVSVSAPGFWR